MRKILLSAIAITVVTSSVMAGDWFVGIDAGHGKADVKASSATVSVNGEMDGGQQALKIGNFVTDNIRVTGSYYRHNTDANVDLSHYKASADYLFGSGDLRPFVGVGVSKFDYKEKNLSASWNKDSIDLSGIGYGVGMGLLYNITKNVSAEINYEYAKLSASDNLIYNSSTAVKVEIDNYSAWHLGLNYKF